MSLVTVLAVLALGAAVVGVGITSAGEDGSSSGSGLSGGGGGFPGGSTSGGTAGGVGAGPGGTPSSPTLGAPSPTAPPTTLLNPQNGGPLLGTWIVQLESVEMTAGTGRLNQLLAEVRETVPNAGVLDSSAYGDLRPNYWVIYSPDSFFDGFEAVAFCDNRGLPMPSRCLGRFLTSDPADLVSSQCYRFDDGSLPSGCRRVS